MRAESKQAFGKRAEVGVDGDITLTEPNANSLQHVCGRNTVVAYYATACIQGVRVEALVDTGASVTMISEEIYNAIPNLSVAPTPSKFPELEGVVAGSKLDIVGEVNLPIKLGKFISPVHPIVIVRGTRSPCIIGLDFLDRFSINIDTANRILSVDPEHYPAFDIPLRPVFHKELVESRVINMNTVVVPPRTVSFIAIGLKDYFEDGDGIIEYLNTDQPNFIIPRSIHSITNGHSEIQCINFSDEPVTIQKNQIVGTFVPVHEGEVPSVSAVDAPEFSEVPEVENLFDLRDSDLNEDQKLVVYALLRKFPSIIGTSEFDLGLTDTITHKIDVQGSKPVKQPYRRFPHPLRREINLELEKLLANGIIEPSDSAWASPLVPVRRKDGKLRLCIDYRAVNALTRRDSFPLPNINDAISQFRDCMYFSSLDLLSGYHQIAMDGDSKEITAFSNGEDLFQFTRMPFGVTNGPASFSRLIAIVLSGIPFNIAQAYLDDILVSGVDFYDHLRNLNQIFARLETHGLKLSAQKCSLFRSEVDYLGHVVGRDGVRPLDKNVEAISQYPRPKTIKQLRTFTGMINFYKKFMDKSEIIMRPLYRATATKTLIWTSECEEAFEEAKKALVSAPVLVYPDFEGGGAFYITCDASGTGMGAVLSQKQQGEERVIAYAGTSFNDAQKRYSATDRELAAIRFAVNHFKSYLYGRSFVVRTDHEPLLYLYHMKRFDDRLHRTMEDLNIGHYEFEYVPGKNNVVADALSRANYPWKVPGEDDARVVVDATSTLESYEAHKVAGGASSLFDAVVHLLPQEGPPGDLRDRLVDKLLTKPSKYGFSEDSRGRKEIKLLKDTEVFPPFNVVQALADLLNSKIYVFFTSGPCIALVPSEGGEKILHLRCSGGIHLDPLVLKANLSLNRRSKELPCKKAEINSIQSLESPRFINLTLNSGLEELKVAQESDPNLKLLTRLVMEGRGETLEGGIKPFKPKFSQLTVRHGVLMFRSFSGKSVPVVPERYLEILAVDLHETLSHAGHDKTTTVMLERYYHPKFPSTIDRMVKECAVCQRHKGRASTGHPIYRRQCDRPYQLYAVDILELPQTKKGTKCVLTGIDLYTKFAHAVPLRNKRSATVARALESHILATVPKTPEGILSDNGPEFRGAPFEDLLRSYGITHEYSVPYMASTNGAVERFNQTLRSRLATATDSDTSRWDKKLYEVVAQYNRTPHADTGKAPADFFVTNSSINIPKSPYWKEPRNFKPFEVGDLVMRKVPFQPAGQRDKLAPRYQGPLKIVSRDHSGVTYRAQWVSGPGKVVQVHISQLKKFHGESEVQNRPIPRAATPRSRLVTGKPFPRRDPFDIGWARLDQIPFSPAHEAGELGMLGDDSGNRDTIEPPAMGGVPPADHPAIVPWVDSPTAADVISEQCSPIAADVISEQHSPPAADVISEQESVHFTDYRSDGESFNTSPSIADVVSEDCFAMAQSSTPRRRVLRSGRYKGMIEEGSFESAREEYFSGFEADDLVVSGSLGVTEPVSSELREAIGFSTVENVMYEGLFGSLVEVQPGAQVGRVESSLDLSELEEGSPSSNSSFQEPSVGPIPGTCKGISEWMQRREPDKFVDINICMNEPRVKTYYTFCVPVDSFNESSEDTF